jgi:exodeoxyribonuclease VIII
VSGDRPNRIVYGMPAAEYHASPGVSNTMLSDLARSPAHCWALHHAPGRPARKTTPAMNAGTLLHTLVLEPEKVPGAYIVRPDGLDGRTKEGKEWAAQAGGLTVLSAEQYATAEAQRDAIFAVPELAALLNAGHSEVSCFWRDEATDLPCRMRADWVSNVVNGRVVLLDLKSTNDASPEGFAKTMARFGYHRQAAHYSTGYANADCVEVVNFVFGVVTQEYPFIAAAYSIAADALEQGQDECATLLETYAQCQRTGVWPAFHSQQVSLPSWAQRSQEIEVSYV